MADTGLPTSDRARQSTRITGGAIMLLACGDTEDDTSPRPRRVRRGTGPLNGRALPEVTPDPAAQFQFRPTRPDPLEGAACKGLDPRWFDRRGTPEARLVCKSCPVQDRCHYALVVSYSPTEEGTA